jgi:hypothetical protein
MRTYKVVRQSNAGETEHQRIKIWDGGDLLWEREADSYVDVNGEMIQLSALTDVQIIELYRKQHE